MKGELIPELHDALKLTTLKDHVPFDPEKAGFSDFDRFSKFSANTRTWQGIIGHHPWEECRSYPTDIETFLLHLADGMAANFSRVHPEFKGEKSFVVHKLWNSQQIFEDKRLKSDAEIIELLNFLNNDPSFEEFATRYDHVLRTRAEDAHAGKNVTSLKTHLILTGKFYRFFKNSEVLKLEKKEIMPSIEQVRELRDSKVKSWQIWVALCKFHFHQNPARARDLNIFELLEETLAQIEREFSDNILFKSGDELLIFYDDPSLLDKITQATQEKGFWLSAIASKAPLNQIKPLPGGGSKHLYKELPATIEPPLCEVCQMDHGGKTWPTDYLAQFREDEEIATEAVEHLCETCFGIRCRPSKLRKLRDWTELQTTDVVWVKISLDYQELTNTLHNLYWNYLKNSVQNAKEKDAEVRFSLVWEFKQDYDEFLTMFTKALISTFGAQNIECLLPDMFCIKAKKTRDSLKIIDIFDQQIETFFREFKRIDASPVKLSVTHASSKFPFFEVWRMIDAQKSDLQINLIGHGKVATSLRYLDQVLLASTRSYRQSSLHKLAEIARVHEKIAELKFYAKTEKGDFETYEQLKQNLLPLGMDFRSILTFAKLLEE